MPSLGADMDAGRVISWRVAPGDHVTRGDVVAEVDTEKSVIEVEVFVTGRVEEILVHEGERVPVGTPLAVIAEDVAPTPAAPTAPAPTAVAPPSRPAGPAPSPLATPRARRRARQLGVDLAAVAGSGPGGAVTTEDVEVFAATLAGPAAPTRGEEALPAEVPAAPLRGEERHAALRRAIAASMARSKREIPHYYLTADIDASAATGWLERHNAEVPVTRRLLPGAVLLKATALALRQTPDLNGFWTQGRFEAGTGIHLGVAIALRGGGLVAPAIADADAASLEELMAALRDLVGRARAGRLRSSETAAGTITVTNLGEQGVDTVLPVIYPPQVAIVGFGRIRPRAWVRDGRLEVAPVVTASLAADHRVTDGHRGAIFLGALDALLQTPEAL
jgi:pyruvate dehydrogenase E2 component (dihydrolipoamide acetyltransferase)